MNKNSWREKTNAKIVTISQLRRKIRESDGIAIGLAGFSGSFTDNERADAELVTSRSLELMLANAVDSRNPSTVYLVSGATNLGVPRIGYAVCKSTRMHDRGGDRWLCNSLILLRNWTT